MSEWHESMKNTLSNFSTHWRTHAENSQEINQRLQNEMNFTLCGLMAYGETAFKHELGKRPVPYIHKITFVGFTVRFSVSVSSECEIKWLPFSRIWCARRLYRRALQKKRNETHRMNYGSIAWNLFLFSWKITTSNSNATPMKKKK